MEHLFLASTRSTALSLASIREGKAELNHHRKQLLAKIPRSDDWVSLSPNTVTNLDLAYLSAKTGDEFALLRGKREDVVFHGTRRECLFVGVIEQKLRTHKLALICHAHPGEDEPTPSPQDRALLRIIGQNKSSIISGRTGRITEFTASLIL